MAPTRVVDGAHPPDHDRSDIDATPRGTLLSVWAHPDDETFLAGGVMARARNRVQRVVCVSLTAGEQGSGESGPPPSVLGPLRRREAAAAMAILGIDEHRILDFPDGHLADVDDIVGTSTISQLIDEVRPDTILTFGDDGITFHPDHRQVSRWVTAAWRRSSHRCSLWYAALTAEHLAEFGAAYEQWGIYMTDERPVGRTDEALAMSVRWIGSDLDRKLAALEAMSSQTGDAIASIGRDLFSRDISVEAFVDAETIIADT
jgi:LmbE family N-acetylglucosaminyl deacetylase